MPNRANNPVPKACFNCPRFIHTNPQIKCDLCNHFFHVKCCSIKSLDHFKKLKASGINWYCQACNYEIFPFTTLPDTEFQTLLCPLFDTLKIPNKKTNVDTATKSDSATKMALGVLLTVPHVALFRT